MKKIYEPMPIEVWKEIALKVQKLDLLENSDEYFASNLETLKELLSGLDICLEEKTKEAKRIEDVGLATLLHSIYSIKDANFCKKVAFYEKIYQLADLGIDKLEYRPVDFYDTITSFRSFNYKEKLSFIYKAYTDGFFNIPVKDAVLDHKCFTNLEEANYILYLKLSIHNNASSIIDSSAILKNFDGFLPSIEEVKKSSFPLIVIPSQTIYTGDGIIGVTELFDHYDTERVIYSKRLLKSKKGELYYE